MKTKALTEAKDPDLRGSAAAMRRAAQLARETAIQSIRVIRGIRGGTFGNSCSFVLFVVPDAEWILRCAQDDTHADKTRTSGPLVPTGDPSARWRSQLRSVWSVCSVGQGVGAGVSKTDALHPIHPRDSRKTEARSR